METFWFGFEFACGALTVYYGLEFFGFVVSRITEVFLG